ncbi:L-threonylcarbamoyladenylate synthase [Streptacidiphilus rugosus]|uniref:L-threonylcarbamoyladenylate synthase n=1 Tax=Streptacidiphilus rugosus TaxID=405783 RepID=UPI00068B7AF8|nr:L-threonylcarbamoyladenylate synthase [Streptacidiphilus rugosus]
MTRIIRPGDVQGLISAADRLRRGAVVVVPTDTNYGVFCDPFNPEAVRRVYEMKKRDGGKPLTLYVSSPTEWQRWAKDPGHPGLDGLLDEVWPGPLNIIVRKRPTVPDWVTAGQESVAVFHNRSQVLNQLAIYAGLPLAATSANISGTMDTGLVDFDTAVEHLGEHIDLAVQGSGASAYTSSSTIVSLLGERPAIVRQGDIGPEIVGRHLTDLAVPADAR